ncbi:E3 ubiquitin-protein ligase RNF149-like isoform X1 [Hypanus sabinus]|uniref:E3 ubiquitin-protein ligase RNF149-like isoform X1 n=1 Tax=Hypanus sabinus TaxID=79690 RepID=UPI0028C4E9B7|nr:E3 ubiquitin-protein ligase RNF149-like isoform X1 [Hypanus sabinus]
MQSGDARTLSQADLLGRDVVGLVCAHTHSHQHECSHTRGGCAESLGPSSLSPRGARFTSAAAAGREATMRRRAAALSPWLMLLLLRPALGAKVEWFTAFVSTAYLDPDTNVTVSASSESGRYGDSSPKDSVQGVIGIPRNNRDQLGCDANTEYFIPRTGEPWIALVARGNCTFKEKILNAAKKMASAVVIYNFLGTGNTTVTMNHIGTRNIVAIMIGNSKGLEILELVHRGIPVIMSISVGSRHVEEWMNSQSVVFVIIAFITMMIISLAWLIFYYIQRFLYAGSSFSSQNKKSKNSRKEARKAINKLQLHTVRHGDREIDLDVEGCAVCIEVYRSRDVVRILPCKHVFHRMCIDPWLLEHRTCPMCKLDVIKALGLMMDTCENVEVVVPESRPDNIPVGNPSASLQEDTEAETSAFPGSPTFESLQHDDRLMEEDEAVALIEGSLENQINSDNSPCPIGCQDSR